MKSWDAIIIGAGIIGLSLAIELNRNGLRVLVVEKGEPGREASWAAGGMLCDFAGEARPELLELASASARMYPEFVHELESESRLKIDLRSFGTILLTRSGSSVSPVGQVHSPAATQLEPALSATALAKQQLTAFVLEERCVDPRHLTAAAISAARHRGIDISSGDHVLALEVAEGKASGVRTNKTSFSAGAVVNCAGAWAKQIGSPAIPTRPVKGQMLSVVMPEKELVRHVVRTPEVYLIPRSDGRLVIGATAEEAGFDKTIVPEAILQLRNSALELVPRLAEARILESWAGLRPGTPDGLPILGATSMPGYFVATGHFRDGILLAPATAKVMGELLTGRKPRLDISRFSAGRFAL